MNKNRNNRGFTLIEMLVAMAMMATIASMVYGSYAVTSKSVESYSSRMACSERASLVLRLMARQIRGAYAPPVDPNQHASTAGIDRTEDQTNSVRPSRILVERVRPIFQGDSQHAHGEVLSFVTTTGLRGGLKEPRGLSQIRYRHDAITNTLRIDCQPYRDRLDHTSFAQSEHPMLDHVTAVEVAFHNGRQWLPKWSGAQSKELPRAVRIGLSLVDEKGRSYHFGTTVQVLSQAIGTPVTSKQTTRDGKL
jgi:prepilin-type N-terminal cleavage/methylation domain-containing protein